MKKFTYSLTYDDYLNFEKFRLKKNRTAFLSYIICIAFLTMGVYDAVAYKSYEMIIVAAILVLVELVTMLYTLNISPKKRVNKYISLDSSYLGEKEITIDEKAIELKYIPKLNEAAVVAIYPYSIMTAIYETEEYYYFILNSEVKILPKKVIPAEISESVKKIISKNGNYMYLSK